MRHRLMRGVGAVLLAGLLLATPSHAYTPYSTYSVTETGTTNIVTVPFPYINQSDVQVYLGTTLLPVTAYAWTSASTIQITAYTAAALSGQTIKLQRVTQILNPDVTFEAGPLSYSDLNTEDSQLLYSMQELWDAGITGLAGGGGGGGSGTVTASTLVVTQPDLNATTRTLQAKLNDRISVLDFLPVNQPDGGTDNSAGFQAAAIAGCARASSGVEIDVPAAPGASQYVAHDVLNTCGNVFAGGGKGNTVISYGGASAFGFEWQPTGFPNFNATIAGHVQGGGIRDLTLVDSTGDTGNWAVISNGTYDWAERDIIVKAACNGFQFFGDEFPSAINISMYNTRCLNYLVKGDLSGQNNTGQESLLTAAASTSGGTVINWAGSTALTAGDPIWFTGTIPSGLSSGTMYYVLAAGLSANTFEVGLYPGASAVSGIAAGTGFTAYENATGATVSTRTDGFFGVNLQNIDNTYTNTMFTIQGLVSDTVLYHVSAEGPNIGVNVNCPVGLAPNLEYCPQHFFADDLEVEYFLTYGMEVFDFNQVKLTKLYLYGEDTTSTANDLYFGSANYANTSVPVGRMLIDQALMFAVQGDCVLQAGTIYDLDIEHSEINGCNTANAGWTGVHLAGSVDHVKINNDTFGNVDGYTGAYPLARAVVLGSGVLWADVSDNIFDGVASGVAPVLNTSSYASTIHIHDNLGPNSVLTLGACGTSPSFPTGGGDAAIFVTVGSGSPTSCAITFSNPWSAAPVCSVTPAPGASNAALSVATSTTTVTLSGTALSGTYGLKCSSY